MYSRFLKSGAYAVAGGLASAVIFIIALNFILDIEYDSGMLITVSLFCALSTGLSSFLASHPSPDRKIRFDDSDAVIGAIRGQQAFMENMPDVFFTYNDNGEIIYVSPGAKNYGYTVDEIIGSKLEDHIHPDDVFKAKKQLMDKISKGDDYPIEFRVKKKDGSYVYVEETGRLVSLDGDSDHYTGVIRDISERKRTEEVLLSRERLLKSSFDAIQDGIIVLDKHLNCLRVNKTIEKWFNECQPILGRKCYKVFFGYDEPCPDCRTAKAIETKSMQSFVKSYSRDHNSMRYFEIFSYPITDDEGQVIGAVEYARDITRRVEAENDLTASHEKYRSLVENLYEGIWKIDMQAITTYTNKRMSEILGYSVDEMQGKSLFYFMDEEMKVVCRDMLQRRNSGVRESHEFRFQHKDGHPVSVLMNASPTFDKKGEVDGAIASVMDISQVKSVMRALEESEKRYQEMFNSVLEGIGIVDENEAIEYCNPAFARLLECESPHKLVGRNLLEFVPEDNHSRIRSQTLQRQQGRSSRYEVDLVTLNGNRITTLVAISPRYNDKNKYIGAFGAVMDITERKQLEEIAARAERLETAGRIAGQVAHDFNNLLGPLTAYPELIKQEIKSDNPIYSYLEDMEIAAAQMAEINQQLLTLGRRGHYNQEPININLIVKHVLDQVYDKPDRLKIETDLQDDLLNVMGGRSQIFRVISNLVNNARDAMPEGGTLNIMTKNIYVDQSSGYYNKVKTGEYVCLTISDSGPGIPEEIQYRILEPFFSTKTADKKKGSGLGLSIVHAVIEDHHGYLDWKSSPEQGTSFYVYLPITRDKIHRSVADNLRGGTERLLIVDDDRIQRNVAANLLEKLGYNVASVASGEKAIKYVKNFRQDLIILDMIMPDGMDGAETYRKILDIYPGQPALVMTGYAEAERVKLALSMGASKILRKPLTLQVLGQAVREILDKNPKTTAKV